MKKAFSTLLVALVAIAGHAQNMEKILQPTKVIGRKMNSSGQVIKETDADFSYMENGKLDTYSFPSHGLITYYSYDGDYLTKEQTWHNAGHPVYNESYNYTYKDGKISTIAHFYGQMETDQYWRYTYNENGRLAQKDYKEEYDSDYYRHYIYEYENEGRTVVESYYTSWPGQGMLLKYKATSQYDEKFRLTTVLTENYNASGEMTSSTLKSVYYASDDEVDSEVTQTLTEGEWTNTTILKYEYHENGIVAERLTGAWSPEKGEWDMTRRTSYAFSDDNQTYTVSFFMKSGDEWVWTAYENQPLFYDSYLQMHQRALRFHYFDPMFYSEQVSQFVFTMNYTNKPVYLSSEENHAEGIGVYPNPGSNQINITTQLETAVVRFYDMNGRLVLAKPFNFGTVIGTESWPSGMYFWEIVANNQKVVCGKWVKE